MEDQDQLCTTYEEVTAIQPRMLPWLLKAIKAASHFEDGTPRPGCPFTGRLTTVRRLMTWLEQNPGFVPNHFLRPAKLPAKPADTLMLRGKALCPPASPGNTPYESAHRRGGHTPSPAESAPRREPAGSRL